MTIKELLEFQMKFDEKHKGKFNWSQSINNENLEILEFLLIALIGEVGETANIVKKIVRGDITLEEKREELSEEIIDIFIYTVKLMYQMDIDVEKLYLEKMEKNGKRFEKFRK